MSIVVRSSVTRIVAFIAFLVIVPGLRAQDGRDLRQGNADYLVPEPVALHALASSSPSLLVPSTVRTYSAAFETGISSMNRRTIVATEFAPVLLGDAITLSEYLSSRLLRVALRTRISFAALDNPGEGFHGALGLRWMAHDDADPRADSLFQRTLSSIALSHPGLAEKCRDDPSCLTDAVSHDESAQHAIDSLRDAMKEKLWNASVFELATAVVYQSPRDAAGQIQDLIISRQYHAYLNVAFPILGTNGQVVFGASGWTGRPDNESTYERRGTISVRAWYGEYFQKMFIESAWETSSASHPIAQTSIGGAIRASNGFWIESGFQISLTGRPETPAGAFVRLSFGTPEIRR